MKSVFKVRVDGLSGVEVAQRIEEAVVLREPMTIATVNAEILLASRFDAEFRARLNRFSLTVVDGFGPWMLLRLFGRSVSRVTGVDLVSTLCKVASRTGASVLLVGGKDGSAMKTVERLKAVYPRATIHAVPIGRVAEPAEIEQAILRAGDEPRFVLLALGAKKQELFAEALVLRGIAQVAIGVGGAFEIISGMLPRAPRLLRVLGLEWSWRLVLQPSRFPRIILAVIVFPFFFIYDRFLGNHAL